MARFALSAMARSLTRTSQLLDKAAEIVTSATLAVVVLINALEILSRTVLNDSQTWVYETNLLLGNWIYFIGIVLVYSKKKDIVIELLLDKLGKRIQKYYIIFLNVVIILVMAVLVFYGWRLIEVQARTATLDLHIPNHLFSLPVVIGAIAIFVIVLAQSVELANKDDLEDATDQ